MDANSILVVVLAGSVWLLIAVVVAAVWVLFFARKQNAHDERVPAGAEAPAARAARTTARADADLSAEVDNLRHAFKLLQNEWTDKESRMDSIIKRLHRFRKLEENGNGAQEETPAPAAPLTREGVLAIYQARQAGKG